MKRLLIIVLVAACFLTNPGHSQDSDQPKLVATWRLGYEDYNEFIYHTLEEFAFGYLKEHPQAKFVARLCSTERMPVALVGSYGFAFSLPRGADGIPLPASKIVLARWSKCENKSEQYWFVPENSHLESDEMIAADKVHANRWLVDDFGDQGLPAGEQEFADNIKRFIAELRNDPQAEGFIIRNLKTRKRKVKEAWEQIQREGFDRSRLHLLHKRVYQTYYPEFMTVSISH